MFGAWPVMMYHTSLRANLVPEQARAQPRPGSHVEDHLPAADRERLDDRLAVALERGGLPVVGAGMLTVGRLPPGPPGRRMCGRRGFR